MLFEQVDLQMKQTKEYKHLVYIEVALGLLLAKINLLNQEFIFDKEKKEIHKPPKEKISADPIHFINSFCESIVHELDITIAQAELTETPELV
jgi:hypothetical protein